MIINCHKINLSVLKNIFWISKPLILKWPYMWVLHLGLIIHLRLFKAPMDYFKMNLHACIAYKFWFSLKGHPNYILVILKWHYMWVLHIGSSLHLRLPKSPKGYIERNLNMGIAFRETQKVYLFPSGNISKLNFFTFF
jgi:hypothetical protein